MVDTREYHIVGNIIRSITCSWLVLFDTKGFTIERYTYPNTNYSYPGGPPIDDW